MICCICNGTNHVSEMTDGRTHHPVCDDCRQIVTPFFHIYGSLDVAVREATQARQGRS